MAKSSKGGASRLPAEVSAADALDADGHPTTTRASGNGSGGGGEERRARRRVTIAEEKRPACAVVSSPGGNAPVGVGNLPVDGSGPQCACACCSAEAAARNAPAVPLGLIGPIAVIGVYGSSHVTNRATGLPRILRERYGFTPLAGVGGRALPRHTDLATLPLDAFAEEGDRRALLELVATLPSVALLRSASGVLCPQAHRQREQKAQKNSPVIISVSCDVCQVMTRRMCARPVAVTVCVCV